MLKIIAIILILPSLSIAADCNLASMLQWKYGAVAGTQNDVITYWNHTSISQPDANQIAQDMIDCRKEYTRTVKKEEVKAEGLRRINLLYPGISSFDEVKFIKEMWTSIAPAARQATTDYQKVIDIYQAGSNSVVVLTNYTGYNQINNYNVVTEPVWP